MQAISLLGALWTITTLLVAVQQASAQSQPAEIVYGSVVFHRSGRRTPILNSTHDATTLTNTGAWQSKTAGQYVRARYAAETTDLIGLSEVVEDPLQVYALASANGDFGVQSAQAFMQGMFPPNNINSSTYQTLDPTNVLWNGSYVQSPGPNAQFVSINTAGAGDVDSINLDAMTYCPAWYTAYNTYVNDLYYANPQQDTDFYTMTGEILGDDIVTSDAYGYWNAYYDYDWVDYQYHYNATYHGKLTSGELSRQNAYSTLKTNADAFNYGIYTSPTPTSNTINPIAGRGLATQILSLLSSNIASNGELSKLSLLFADFQPLYSLFSLANLPTSSGEQFTAPPNYGSHAIFELYAFTSDTILQNSTSPITSTPLSYPSISDLYVRFLFANGSDPSSADTGPSKLIEYPLFAPSFTAGPPPPMPWSEFMTAMQSIAFASPADWCNACDAWSQSVFCLYYNTTAWAGLRYLQNTHHGITPNAAVAGVIGAVVTLAVIALACVIAFFIGGVGLARRRAPVWARARNEPGMGSGKKNRGFKGGSKMPSDADLAIVNTKSGAGVGTVEKERVGSWELRHHNSNDTTTRVRNEGGNIDAVAVGAAPVHGIVEDRGKAGFGHWQGRTASFVSSVRSSFDSGGNKRARDGEVNPFGDPVVPRENV